MSSRSCSLPEMKRYTSTASYVGPYWLSCERRRRIGGPPAVGTAVADTDGVCHDLARVAIHPNR